MFFDLTWNKNFSSRKWWWGGEGRADATPAPLSLQPCIETPKRRTLVTNEIRTNTDEIYDLHEYVQSLATEMEAMK